MKLEFSISKKAKKIRTALIFVLILIFIVSEWKDIGRGMHDAHVDHMQHDQK